MTIDNRIEVVLIDDDPHLRQALSQTLDLAGLNILSLAEAGASPDNCRGTGRAWWSATFACRASTASNC